MKSAFVRSAEDHWKRYEVDKLTLRDAAHLMRRAGFGCSWPELQEAANVPLEELVDRQLAARETADFEQQSQAMKGVIQSGNLPVQLPAWWLYRLQQTSCQAWEKLVLFWHGHFATSAAKVTSAAAMLAQNEVLRQHAFGPFKQLVLAISRDPAMLIYLDSATNRRNNPNENYARELLELFCLGIGNYGEDDIRELARAFTGWEIIRGRFTFNPFQHDPAPKTFLGKSGIDGGEEAVAWIVGQPAAAEFIANKLYRYYISDEPASPEVIAPLADVFREQGFAIQPALKKIFTSRIFYSDAAYAKKIRSPVELLIGLLRCLNATTSPVSLSRQLAELGQSLFYPPNVKGWDGGRRWINSATVVGRINLVTRILDHEQTHYADGRGKLDNQLHIASATDAVQRVESMWLARPLDNGQRRQLIEIVNQRQSKGDGKWLSAIKAAATMAEFQLG